MKVSRMKNAVCGAVAFAAVAMSAHAGTLTDRWVFICDMLVDDGCVEKLSNIVVTAKAGGMNGVMFASGIDSYRIWADIRKERLETFRRICEAEGMELVPIIWPLGHSGMQSYGLDYIEGIPVENVPFRVEGTNAVCDTGLTHKVPINPKVGMQRTGGYMRLIKKVTVKPRRRYRYSFEFRTKDLTATEPFQVIAVDVRASRFHPKEQIKVEYRPTQDWTPCELSFNTSESDCFYLYIGMMSGWKTGDLEVRNATLEEIAPGNILQRPGAPCVLRNAITGRKYKLGRDYVVPKLKYRMSRQDLPPATLALPPGSRVKKGDRLLMDCYAPAVVIGDHVSICLSEPHLYESLKDSAALIEGALRPKKWMISMDEFRNGGTCAACRARGMTMGQIYADALTKAFKIIRDTHPGAEVYTWSDMLDPEHNGVKEYYNCRGSFEDAWKWIPKDIVICCWYNRKAESSMKFFSSRGFRTFAAAYYDEKPPFEYSRRWRDAVIATEGATGIMYTTWRHSYKDLPAFCELLKGK